MPPVDLTPLPTMEDQLVAKLKQHDDDIAKLSALLELYRNSSAVRRFAELLGIRLN